MPHSGCENGEFAELRHLKLPDVSLKQVLYYIFRFFFFNCKVESASEFFTLRNSRKKILLKPELNSNHCSALLEFGSIPVLLPFGRSCGNTGAFS